MLKVHCPGLPATTLQAFRALSNPPWSAKVLTHMLRKDMTFLAPDMVNSSENGRVILLLQTISSPLKRL
jgi:hypothetical protein